MVVHAYYPIGETRVEREALVLRDHGFEVDIFCLGSIKEPTHEVISGINVYHLPIEHHFKNNLFTQFLEYLAFFVLVTFKLVALQHNRHYKVIQVHNLPDWLVFSCLLPKLMGARVILDLHDLMPEFFAAKFNKSINSRIVKLIIWQEQLSCRFADHVITVTDFWRETLIKRGLSSSKVSVVMNVADDRVFCQPASDSRPHQSNGSFRLFYHGNLTYRYGIDLAIRAVSKVQNQIPDIQLHIHGWGDYSQKLVDLTEELGLKDHVRFSSHSLLTSELPQLIRQADVCLVPYRDDIFTDGILPTKLMEYSSLGMPVISSHTSAIARYFDDTMVQFVEPGNAEDIARRIYDLYRDPARVSELALGCQKFNLRYNWSKIGTDYVGLVERIGDNGKFTIDNR